MKNLKHIGLIAMLLGAAAGGALLKNKYSAKEYTYYPFSQKRLAYEAKTGNWYYESRRIVDRWENRGLVL
jgi:hypothetical protein